MIAPSPAEERASSLAYIPSLNGLRALSICLVLLGHLSGTRHFTTVDLGIGDYPNLGVIVFFVISGFLITSLLNKEREKTGRVSLKLFYARRALRIFPAAYLFIACTSLLWASGLIHLHPADLWHAVSYTVNYEAFRSWQVGHLWSLSVEEQFYLLWPCAYAFLGPRRAVWVAVGLLFLGPVARVADWIVFRRTPYYDLEMFPMLADSLAAGCLLASTRSWLERQNWYLRLFQPGYSVLLFGMMLLANRWLDYTPMRVLGMSFVNIALAVLIHRAVYRPHDWVGRILNWKPVAWVGVLSYSLYLWQQLFINRNSTAWLNAFPQNLLLAVLTAVVSYFLLEKPLLKLRAQLRPVSHRR